jgi:hypothetical protein
MDEILKNLYVLSKTYNELYKCCEILSSIYLDLEEKESVSKKKNFKELLKNYNKTEEDYVVELNLIKEKIEMKLDQFILLQNNLRIKGSFIEQLESKKIC